MKLIEILGPGCYDCHLTEQAALEAVATAAVEVKVIKVIDHARIGAHHAMHPPGLVIDGQGVSSGRIPSAAEIAGWLATE